MWSFFLSKEILYLLNKKHSDFVKGGQETFVERKKAFVSQEYGEDQFLEERPLFM